MDSCNIQQQVQRQPAVHIRRFVGRKVLAEWARIPKAGEVPMPEEVIAYYAALLSEQK